MGHRTVKRILLILISCFVVTLAIGQGCSKLGSGSSKNASDNGGGYGGLVPTDNGTYTAGFKAPDSESSQPVPYFYLVGVHTGCTNYPSGWESVGPDVVGVISFSSNGTFYAPSLCDASSVIAFTDLSIVDFDQSVAIYNDGIYRHFAGAPPPTIELVTPVAYCRTVSTDAGNVQIGTDVSVYTSGGQLYGEIDEGQDVNGQPTQFSVSPFPLSQTVTSGQASFSGNSFQLDVIRNGSPATTGTLSVVLDGQSESLSMSCWLTTP
jgi:hypothetical protein